MTRQKYIIFAFVALVILLVAGFSVLFLRTQIFSVRTEEAEPVLVVPSQDENPEWEKYRNLKYGYEIQYPSGWTVWNSEQGKREVASGNEWAIAMGTQESFDNYRVIPHAISIYVRERDGCQIDPTNEYMSCGHDDNSRILSYDEIRVSSDKAVFFHVDTRLSGCEEYRVRLRRKDYVYWIYANCEGDDRKPNELFSEILSTFKFIEPDKISE